MLRNESKQYSLYSILYDKIPENHILKLIDKAVDFSFINKLLEKSYCKYYGRPAKEPEMMIRLLILQYLYSLSDEKIIDETSLNLAYMWFIGVNPEESLPHPSLLAKFRVHKLQEVTIDDIIKEVIRQCVENGIIKSNGVSIDATHTHANTIKKVPERILKHMAKKILKSIEEEKGTIPENIDTNIPDYKSIEDPTAAKETMKIYVEKLIEEVEQHTDPAEIPATTKFIDNVRNIMGDEKFLQQKGVRSLVDQDARVGHKTKTENFFGYKTEFIMTTEERLITAVSVNDGAYVDGTDFEELYELTKESGIEVKEVYGDKAYFRKSILDKIKEDEAKSYIPVSESVYRLDESKYSYNKDSDQWFCRFGNCTVKKKNKTDKRGRKTILYSFEKEICRNCPHREECMSGKTVGKKLEVGINSAEFYEYSQRAKTEEFLEKYRNRSAHEWKNGEMKRFHGLNRAKGYGLRSMGIQARLTALAVNLKRIAKLVSSLNSNIFYFSWCFKIFHYKNNLWENPSF
jgi:transposase